MSGNIFGTLFKLTTFGESHGPAIGGVIDGWFSVIFGAFRKACGFCVKNKNFHCNIYINSM